jgi:predicted N-acetyltransferase YhbS
MQIRRITPHERIETSLPLRGYAFMPSPASADEWAKMREHLAYSAGDVTLVAQDGGQTLATVSAIPMRQNVRGSVYPMAGIAGVTTHPLARRQGHIRTLLTRLLGDLRDEGHPVSALYPFRSSFYQRFGYIDLPKSPSVTFSPAALDALLRAQLPGEIAWTRAKDGYDDHAQLIRTLLARRHGFAAFPEYRAVGLRDADARWLAVARAGGEVVGAVAYRITDHGDELVADDLLTTGPLGRALLLQFFARHVDQVASVSMTVDPEESPEQWATDLEFVSESRVSFPTSPGPMARVLSLDALAGMAVGPGRVAATVVDDPFVAGDYLLDGVSGKLDVARGGTASVPAATLLAAGLSALVYGVLDPAELPLRGLGTVPDDAAAALRTVFGRRRPHVAARF